MKVCIRTAGPAWPLLKDTKVKSIGIHNGRYEFEQVLNLVHSSLEVSSICYLKLVVHSGNKCEDLI